MATRLRGHVGTWARGRPTPWARGHVGTWARGRAPGEGLPPPLHASLPRWRVCGCRTQRTSQCSDCISALAVPAACPQPKARDLLSLSGSNLQEAWEGGAWFAVNTQAWERAQARAPALPLTTWATSLCFRALSYKMGPRAPGKRTSSLSLGN